MKQWDNKPSGQIKHSTLAYTLIELLTVLTVMGILATIAIPNYSRLKIRSEITISKQNLKEIANAVQTFSMDHGKYPSSNTFDSILDLWALERNGYISSTQYPDPFQQPVPDETIESQSSNGLGSAASERDNGFVYINYRNLLGQDIPAFTGISLYSIGPDRNDSGLSLYPLPDSTRLLIQRKLLPVYGERVFDPIVVYNPTNGLYSSGDYGVFRGEFNGFVPKDTF